MDAKHFTALTKSLLDRIGQQAISALDVEDMIACLQFHETQYYVNDHPLIADIEYDTLFNTLKKIETENPNLIQSHSPTQRVAMGLNKNFSTVNHLVPMLSLDNTYNEADLVDWDRRCKELSGATQITYCVEPKYDGASISLIYENDKLVRGATRGDGVAGDDITNNTKQIRSIPLQANISQLKMQQAEIRGEVVITKSRFAAYNESLVAEGLAPLANPRNAASGALRMKDPAEVAKRNLDAFLYHVSFINYQTGEAVLKTHYDTLEALHQLGFKTSVGGAKVFDNINDVVTYVHDFESKRDDLPFEIDGMVIKVNDFALQEAVGQTSHHPRWAVAFKFKARQATSKLLKIEYQVGRTGSITPVAKITPVAVGGVTISSLSLFNADIIKEKDLRIGDTVLIERAGDVIPYVVKSFAELRDGTEEIVTFPTRCPVCEHELTKPEEEAVWRCANINCVAQVAERLIHFASKDAMDIRGLGDANIRKFFELKILNSLDGIYTLPYEQIKVVEGFGEKSIEKMQQAIEQSKSQPLNRIIFALGIRYVGETTAKTLARSIQHISDLYTKTIEDLLQLEDVGIKVASSIVQFFADDENKDLIHRLEQLGINFNNTTNSSIAVDGNLSGKTFLFTGTLTQFKRSEAEAQVEARGGSILGGVSSKLNYLVVGADAGSKLEKAKKLGTITILEETEFMELMNG